MTDETGNGADKEVAVVAAGTDRAYTLLVPDCSDTATTWEHGDRHVTGDQQ
jgi:hypothetical protein